jgi:hypothetical protein
MFARIAVVVVVVISSLLLVVERAAATTIVSNNFSLGYGYKSPSWNTTETVSANTGVTGDFTLNVAFQPSVAFTSADGVTFVNRVLATSAEASTIGRTDQFSLSVTATYTGILPAGQTKLVIDDIRIRAGNHTANGLSNVDNGFSDLINWFETTSGNAGSGPATDLGVRSDVYTALSSYNLVSWNPADIGVNGVTSTRLFDLNTNGELLAYLDGFEIFGHIEFTPEPAPEPSTQLLLAAGLFGLMKRTSRRRKNAVAKVLC